MTKRYSTLPGATELIREWASTASRGASLAIDCIVVDEGILSVSLDFAKVTVRLAPITMHGASCEQEERFVTTVFESAFLLTALERMLGRLGIFLPIKATR